jgi:hypothetical protein
MSHGVCRKQVVSMRKQLKGVKLRGGGTNSMLGLPPHPPHNILSAATPRDFGRSGLVSLPLFISGRTRSLPLTRAGALI